MTLRVPPAVVAAGLLALSACSDPGDSDSGGGDGVPTQRAAVQDENTVAVAGVRAVIERAPFRLRFFDAKGREVLASVSGATPAPAPAVYLGDLLALVEDQTLPPAQYAPFTFVTGAVAMLQHHIFFVTGNPLLTVSAGMQFALTDVTAQERLPDGGVKLEVATNDPSGRKALVELRPDQGAALKISLRFVPDTGIAFAGAAFASGSDEAFHGFGGRRNAVDFAGQSFFNFIDQSVLDPPLGKPQTQSGWYQQAQFISSRPYGFFLEHSEFSRWRMRSDRDDAWLVDVASKQLNFTVAPGDAKQAIAAITAITGRNPVPPAWHLAPIFAQTLTGGTTGKSPAAYEAEIRESIAMIKQLKLPYESFSFEAWALFKRSGRLAQVMQMLRDNGLRPIVYFRAWAGNDAQGLEDDAAFQDALLNGYGATLPDGRTPYPIADTIDPDSLAVLLDFTKPATLQWWRARVREALDAGADGFMQDFGEQAMWDMRFADGSTGRSMHNHYPVVFHRATREVFDEWHAEHPERDAPMFYVRAGYSGRPGSAAYESASWCGDYSADWSRTTGLAALTSDMLNRGLGGAYGFHCDTGGYIDLFNRTTKELFIRWSWYAALTPGNRLHGGPVQGQIFPWSFDEEAARLHRRSLELHRAAEPYLLKLWKEAFATGLPIARPLWLAFPELPGVHQMDQQYMLGEDVLIAPVVVPGVTEWAVTFPPGCWRHPETGERYEGPETISVPAPLDVHPYFFRCGTRPFTARYSE